MPACSRTRHDSFVNSGRNILDGPGLKTFNISVLKNTSLGGHGTLQFRTEFSPY
jgi:hypothetical protein